MSCKVVYRKNLTLSMYAICLRIPYLLEWPTFGDAQWKANERLLNSQLVMLYKKKEMIWKKRWNGYLSHVYIIKYT